MITIPIQSQISLHLDDKFPPKMSLLVNLPELDPIEIKVDNGPFKEALRKFAEECLRYSLAAASE